MELKKTGVGRKKEVHGDKGGEDPRVTALKKTVANAADLYPKPQRK